MTAIRIIDDHLELANIGSNTHSQIDTELTALRGISGAADSPMIISGGLLSEGTNAGTFKVAALTAMLRSTDSSTGDLAAVSLAEQDNQTITAADTTYRVILNYNGGSPTISIGVDNPYDSDKRNIPIGRIMKDAVDTIHHLNSGYRLQGGVEKLHERARAVRNIELESGSTISYSGVNNFIMTEGLVYAGINKFAISSYDSAAVTFTPIYLDGGGGWTEGAASNTIDTAHYDDGDGVLGDIGNNRYGNFWIYKHVDDHVYALYGRDSYTLAEAEAAGEPSHPDHLDYFGLLVGKIVAPKLGGSFTLIQMVTDSHLTAVAASDHNNLGGLQGGTLAEYYHLTSIELTKLGGIENAATADQTKADIDSLGLSHDSLVDVSTDDHHAQLHSIASHNDTTATGAELETLTDNSIADTLHRHSELVASDGSPDPALSIDSIRRVGIGTESPGRILELSDAVPGFRLTDEDVSGLYHEFLGTSNTGIEFRIDEGNVAADSYFRIDIDGTERIRIDDNGKVGIGTSTPQTLLHLSGSSIGIRVSTDAGSPFVEWYDEDDDDYFKMFMNRGSDFLSIKSNDVDDMMIIKKNGHIGVGTSSPATSSLLDLTSTTGALLLTRMTTTQKNALTAVNGMLLYDSTLNKIQGRQAGSWQNLI